METIYRWDLDKTYLRSDFDTLRELVRTALLTASERENIPGTAALLRELRFDPDGNVNRIFVVSGSPRQMQRVLAEKLMLDGVTVDGLELKPNLENLLRGRFRALRDQLGYKLPILLETRLALPDVTAPEICFGDDAEMDVVIYRLFGELCAGTVDGPLLDAILAAARLYPDQNARIRSAVARLPRTGIDPVRRIFINLEVGSPVARFESYGPRVVPTFNAFQAALVLQQDGHLTVAAVGRVADELLTKHDLTRRRLENALTDAVRRGLVDAAQLEPVCTMLALPRPTVRPPVRVPERAIDYVARLDELSRIHQERKLLRRPSLRELLGLGRER